MIPKIIHQSWKVETVPHRWATYQQSWKDQHPGYAYRFWTDEANRAFVAGHYPELLAVYDGYPHPICRADLARCLVVRHFGGIYADLDCEALRPLDDLLDDRRIIFGLEPHSHVDKPPVVERGLKRIVCNAVFASVPNHPFWDHLMPMLVARRNEPNVLEATGPFVLTRAIESYPRPEEITILASSVFYPIDHYLKPAAAETAGAYTIHHWAGSWWRGTLLRNAWDRLRAGRAEGATPRSPGVPR